MSDQPLFRESDEQEAVFAPEQRPGADDQDNGGQPGLDQPPLAVPAAGILGGGLAGASGPGSGNLGTGVPGAASAELAAETSDDDSDDPERA